MNGSDITGQKFGRLTALGPGEKRAGGRVWHFSCDCGARTVTTPFKVRSGATRSCGCLMRELAAAQHYKHGGKKGGTEQERRLYRIWRRMRQRCRDSNIREWARYGGRGIYVCAEWNEAFEPFRDWSLANDYDDGLTIDRINNDGPYSPGNCRWVDMTVQRANRCDSLGARAC